MQAISSSLKGVPSWRMMSWNHSSGSFPSGRTSSQAKLVLVLPATKPQLMAEMFSSRITGRLSWKVPPNLRAMYSVQKIGLPSRERVSWAARCTKAGP
jgi:hypothetical protein